MTRKAKVHPVDPIDDELANGPLQKRSCTDILWLLLFILFILGMFSITGYAIDKGNPELIGRGYDSDGKICGYSEGYEDYPLLYWPAPVDGFLTNTVCVASCPKTPLSTSVRCKTNSQHPTCEGLKNIKDIRRDLTNGLTNNQTFFVYDTLPVAGRICAPATGMDFFAPVAEEFLKSGLIGHWVSDIRTTWPIIVASIGIAVAVGLVYMILMRHCVGVLTWTAILLFIVGTAVLGWRFYDHSEDLKREREGIAHFEGDNSNLKKTETTEKTIAAICWFLTLVAVVTVFCFYTRIRLAIGVMKAAADYIKDTITVLLVPPAFFILLFVFYVYWTITAVFLVSAGTPVEIKNMPVGAFSFDKTLERFLIYHLFALLWICAFISAALQFVIASSVGVWYFSQGTGQGNPGSVRKGIYRLIRYHLGSIALGSLILALTQFIRLALTYIDKKAKQLTGRDGNIISFFLKCTKCCVACFERFIQFLNKYAYIQIALKGKGFCRSAMAGLHLIVSNPLRFGVLNIVGDIFVFFGKIFITCVSTLIGFVIITNSGLYKNSIYSPFIPALLMVIFNFTIGSLFLNIYGLAGDAILACFVIDEETQKKKNAPPLHCPSSLKGLLDRQG